MLEPVEHYKNIFIGLLAIMTTKKTATEELCALIEHELPADMAIACKTLFALGCYHYYCDNAQAGLKTILTSLNMIRNKLPIELRDTVYRELYSNPRKSGLEIQAPFEVYRLIEGIPKSPFEGVTYDDIKKTNEMLDEYILTGTIRKNRK